MLGYFASTLGLVDVCLARKGFLGFLNSKKVAVSPDGLSIQCDFKMARLKLHGRADSEETKRSHEIAKGKATNTNGKVGLGAVLGCLGAVLGLKMAHDGPR